ncbi:hypothetical protein WR25_25424 [Diploscapter pachys]|uniref:Protein Wnt n=1 Tax=Diploscapter pachys TaxID=2018661 RepID=A0A2A2JGH3_9BILA|nr:hypothetical protein WR25_25424 [Diploscapter pachys]
MESTSRYQNANTLSLTNAGIVPASRESAFVYALTSAGVTHSISKACAKGLIEDCGCGPLLSESAPAISQQSSYYQTTFSTQAHASQFAWSGCSDNVKFGNSFGRKFLDAGEKVDENASARWLMNVHNNRVGRRVAANTMRTECKCHGVSGSCVTKTCWKVANRLSNITTLLRKKYTNAQQVIVKPNSNALIIQSITSSGRGRTGRYLSEAKANKIAKSDLIYLEDSPDYCSIDMSGRECGDNCNEICCGRGWKTIRELVEEPCHCQFVWCCEVKCQTCRKMLSLVLSACLVGLLSAATYSDDVARNKMLPLAAAAYSSNPQLCLTNKFTNAVLKKEYNIGCDLLHADTCSGYLATLNGDQAILLAFRGTQGFLQLVMEADKSVFKDHVNWIAGGQVSKYFSDAFMAVWNHGMKNDYLTLRSQYPNYQVWVTGHSLGGAMANLAASYLIANKLADAANVQVVTFGEPRVGDPTFAASNDKQLSYHFRVTHSRDVVPHIPEEAFGYKHQQYEVGS